MNPSYVLADDLSGALEAGAAFLARGWRVTLPLGAADGATSPSATLALHSTETRNVRGEAAAVTVRRLLAARRAAGGQLLFKKIDSTLRGPVGPELAAVQEEIAPPLLVVCPATPSAGRTVRDGRLLVHGTPVADTEFGRDPGWPVTESRIATLLAAAGIEEVASLSLARLRSDRGLEPGDGRGMLVSDAETDADLARLVTMVRHHEPRAVFVGAGGLAQAVAAHTDRPAGLVPLAWSAPASVLIISGSMHQKSRRQLEVLRDRHGVPLHEASLAAGAEGEAARALAGSLATAGRAALTVAGGSHPVDSAEPVRRLVAVVRQLAKVAPLPDLIALTGGETARAICAGLAVEQLELVREFERGVVVCAALRKQSGGPRYLAIKPGGFGSDEVWFDLIRGNER